MCRGGEDIGRLKAIYGRVCGSISRDAGHLAETTDIATCQALRRVVFIEEQGVSVQDEVDGRDGEARHLLARIEGRPIGTARLLTEGTGQDRSGLRGREARGKGVGAALIRAAVGVFRGCRGSAR